MSQTKQCPVHPDAGLLSSGGEMFCPKCWNTIPPAGVQQKLGLDPGRAQTIVDASEEQVMQSIIAALAQRGYLVLSTVHRHTRHTCSKCGMNEWHGGGYGATQGVPDLLVRLPSWKTATWLGIEVKGRTTKISPAQETLAKQRAIVIVRTLEEALLAIEEV